MALPKTRGSLRAFILFSAGFCLIAAIGPLPAAADNTGLLWGRALAAGGTAVPGVKITLAGENIKEEISTAADEAGWYAISGLRPGIYTVRAEAPLFAAAIREHVVVEPAASVSATFLLERTGAAAAGRTGVLEDLLPASRTVITRAQIERLPTGNSLNSLIENQDSISTSNRIDVGGMWEALPSLFGSRGAVSWTQNTYAMNGLDITEPFSGGTPLIVADIYALESFSLANSAFPIQAGTPGAAIDLVPREGASEFHGGIWGFYLDKSFASSNITPALEKEGLTESDTFNRLMDLNFHLSGPLGGSSWNYFTSWSSYSVARDLADVASLDESRLASGTIHLVRENGRRRLRIFWTGQLVSSPSFGAGRDIPLEATVQRKETRSLLQLISESKPGTGSSSRYGLSLGFYGGDDSLQSDGQTPRRIEMFRNLPSGNGTAAAAERRVRLSAFLDGRAFAKNVGGTQHLFEYGAQLQYASSSSEETIPGNIRLLFYNGAPSQVTEFGSPFDYGAKAARFDAYLQDRITLAGGVMLSIGLRAAGTLGASGSSSLQCFNLSPRFAFEIPFSRTRTSGFRITAARYYWALPLSWLTWGNAEAPGSLTYAWTDANGDSLYTPDERGALLRREGPRYGAIDEKLRLPSTDELTASIKFDLGRGWLLSLAGFLRQTQNLVETDNTGVPLSSYVARTISDAGDDMIPDSYDDLTFTVYDQKADTLGRDFYLLSNAGGAARKSTYRGLDLVLFKRPTDKSLFFLAATATHAVQTNSPGNSALENDDGVIGALYDNPNASINAEGRPRFDRAYTVRIGFSQDLPWNTRLGFVARYYDGQPFARFIIVEGLTQGPVLIQAHPRGVARYEFNMTVDLRAEKDIRFSFGTLRLLFDVFNLFNQHLATEESPWTLPTFPLRYATDIQSPRVFRLGLNFEF